MADVNSLSCWAKRFDGRGILWSRLRERLAFRAPCNVMVRDQALDLNPVHSTQRCFRFAESFLSDLRTRAALASLLGYKSAA
jgi:hypothetical protein